MKDLKLSRDKFLDDRIKNSKEALEFLSKENLSTGNYEVLLNTYILNLIKEKYNGSVFDSNKLAKEIPQDIYTDLGVVRGRNPNITLTYICENLVSLGELKEGKSWDEFYDK